MDKLTKEEAICLFHRQWSDMQMAYGDKPTFSDRVVYKREWCRLHGYSYVADDCFLCEWVKQNKTGCNFCPIDWNFDKQNKYGNYCFHGTVGYAHSPISEILALPERKENEH